ncbi:MAG: ferredoxin, partial [Vulcanococcus sp.]
MAHTIVTDVCEGIADCVDACPVACINPGSG